MFKARCISNVVDNVLYTVGKSYTIDEQGISSNFWKDTMTSQWEDQFALDLKPEFADGVTFKRGGCEFIIEEGEEKEDGSTK